MATEIERKFLLKNDSWKTEAGIGKIYHQGYIVSTQEKTVRVRIAGDEGFITIKGSPKEGSFSRSEFEYTIPLLDATEMLNTLCNSGQIEKTRYIINKNNHIWEIDVFTGLNDGLIIAEIELSSESETFELPSWIGEEVTFDKKYANALLVNHPYSAWNK